MSQVIICDICGARVGLEKIRLTVNAVIDPRGDLAAEETQTIDVCRSCIQAVPDLSSDHAIDELKRLAAKAHPWRFDPTKA